MVDVVVFNRVPSLSTCVTGDSTQGVFITSTVTFSRDSCCSFLIGARHVWKFERRLLFRRSKPSCVLPSSAVLHVEGDPLMSGLVC